MSSFACWICGHAPVKKVKASDFKEAVTGKAFHITNSDYGVTFAIYACPRCGFLECPEAGNVLSHYENMEDRSY